MKHPDVQLTAAGLVHLSAAAANAAFLRLERLDEALVSDEDLNLTGDDVARAAAVFQNARILYASVEELVRWRPER